MAKGNDQDSIDLILHVLQEHEEKIESIEKSLSDLKKIIQYYTPVLRELSKQDKESTNNQSDAHQSILVVDDDPNIVKTYKMILEGNGYTVETATNALDAIRKASRIHFDLVIVDMNLPDTLGDQLAERLAGINTKLKFIMITGYSNYKEQLDKNIDITHVLMKPINPEELVSVTKKTLEKG